MVTPARPTASVAPGVRATASGWKTISLSIAAAWVLLFTMLFLREPLRLVPAERTRGELLFHLPELLAQNSEQATLSAGDFFEHRGVLLLIVGLILAGSLGLGDLVLRMIGLPQRLRSLEGCVLTLGLGISMWSLITLALGYAGVMTQSLFVGLAALAFGMMIFRRWQSQSVPSTDKTDATSSDDEYFPRWMRWGVLITAALFLLPAILGALLPPTEFDVREYHLQGPKEYYRAGQIRFLPHNVYTSFPFLTEMISLSAMIVRGDWYWGGVAGKATLFTFAPLTALALLALGKRLFGVAAGWVAALFYLSTPWTVLIGNVGYNEGALCCYLTLSLLAFVRWREAEEEDRSRWMLLIGLLTGSAAATKYPGVLMVVLPIAAALLWCGHCRLGFWKQLPLFALGILITFGPWLLKNTIETGNPVYPLMWGVFGGTDINTDLHERWTKAHALPVQLVQHPSRIIPDLVDKGWSLIARSEWQSGLLFAFAPLSLLLIRHQRRVLWLWLYALTMFLTWCWLTHRIDRFWVPMVPVLSLLAGAGLSTLLRTNNELREDVCESRGGGHPLLRAATLLIPLCMIVSAGTLLALQLGLCTSPLCGPNNYLSNMELFRRKSTSHSVALLNRLPLKETDRVLFVGDAALFDASFNYNYNTVFDRNLLEELCIGDEEAEQVELPDIAVLRARFASAGITHLCVNWSEIARYSQPGNYGYTNFVTSARMEELVRIGLIERVNTEANATYTDVDIYRVLSDS